MKFLKAAYSKHTNGESLNSVVELGCGPALHTIGLARSGVPSCTGIDLNDHMLQYARWRYGQDQPGGTGRPAGGTKGGKGSDKAGKGFASPKPSSSSSSPVAPASQTLELIKADMAAFDLSALRGRCDMIMCLLGTFSHMLDNDRRDGSMGRRHCSPPCTYMSLSPYSHAHSSQFTFAHASAFMQGGHGFPQHFGPSAAGGAAGS